MSGLGHRHTQKPSLISQGEGPQKKRITLGNGNPFKLAPALHDRRRKVGLLRAVLVALCAIQKMFAILRNSLQCRCWWGRREDKWDYYSVHVVALGIRGRAKAPVVVMAHNHGGGGGEAVITNGWQGVLVYLVPFIEMGQNEECGWAKGYVDSLSLLSPL
jgi:hypothetical protein